MREKTSLVLLWLLLMAAPLHAGGQAVDFSFIGLDGKTYTAAGLKGTAVVINIGSHWWHKCKDEAPALQKNYLAFKDKGVLFLGVFAMSEANEIKEFAEAYHLTFPVGKESGIAGQLNVKGMPETIFIGRDSQIVKRHSGSISDEDLQAGVKELLN